MIVLHFVQPCAGESCSRKTRSWLRLRRYYMLCVVKSVLETGKSNAWLLDRGKVICATITLCLQCVCDYIFNHVVCFLSSCKTFPDVLCRRKSICVTSKLVLIVQSRVLLPYLLNAPWTPLSVLSVFIASLHGFFSDPSALNHGVSLVLSLLLQYEMRIFLVSLSS